MGDEVLLSTRNLLVQVAARGSRKLGPLYCGPFAVLEKLTSAYRLDLPPHMRVHPMFHVSQLKLCKKPEDTMRRYRNLVLSGQLLARRSLKSRRSLITENEDVARKQQLNI